jgi:23S rRNA pseudouridine2605 synthase
VRLKYKFNMDSELENKSQDSSAAEQNQNQSSREGYKPVGNYSRDYRSNTGRPQRPRIHTQSAFNSNRNGSNDEGGFRPEGFGAGLQSGDGASQPRPYRPRFNNNGGGYQSRDGGGYQPRQQGGGYRPRYNNNDGDGGYQSRGGYQPRQQDGGYRPRYNNDGEGGYQPRQQGGYQSRGGYQPRQQGGYQSQQGGYQSQQGGYQSRQGGGYQQRQGGGYQQRQGGGYNRGGGFQRGGYNNNRGGYGQGGGYNQGGYRPHTADYDPNAKYSLKKRIEYKEEHIDPNEPIRLNKYLANAGVCSRREADEFIQAGVVSVNGTVVTELGTKVMRSDEVKFHDQSVSLEKKVYVLLNKPKDYVTTSDDPQQRKTVMDLVKDACPERIYPVGRLDRNTTGVLLLTNDGELASKLTHPKFLKKKVYHVYLDKNVTAHDLQQIADGVTLEDGEVHADAIEYADDFDKSQVGIEIHSGKNRIVRRIFESLGYRVVKLDRVQFAGLTKKNLRRGDWRFLTEKEVEMLRMGAFE